LLAQLLFVEAGLPQFSTPSASAVAVAPIAIIVMAISRPDIDASRPDLNAHLRERYSGKNKRNGSKYDENASAHDILLARGGTVSARVAPIAGAG
jgi:hypothetical protein